MMLLPLVTSGLLLVFAEPSPAPGGAATPATRREILETALSRFDQAVDLKDHGSQQARRLYRESLRGFDALIRDGVNNGHLYYDAANAHLRLGEVGPAIADYRRALRLLPSDQDVRRNLNFARSLCEIQIPPTPQGAILQTIFFWHFDTSLRSRKHVALATYVLFWMVLVGWLLFRRRGVVFGWSTAALAAVALAVGISVGWDMGARQHDRQGVIISDAAVLRKGNGEGYQPQLERPLSEGVELRILEDRSDAKKNVWYHVELPDGKDGWVRADQTEII